MLIEQISEFDLRGPGPPGRICTPKLVIFMTKQNSFKEDLRADYYLLLKYCRRQCILAYFHLPAPIHLQSLTPKCNVLNVFWV